MSARRILLLGAPGAGKGTQAERLCKTLGVPHVSTGDMLRAAVAAETAVGKRAKAVMEAGQLVSDEIVIALCEERLSEPDARGGFILDGFPRNLVQAEALDELLVALGAPLERCLAVHVESEELVQRLLKRAELEGRVDDNEETIRVRMRVYEAETEPLLSYYRSRDLLREIAGAGSIEEIARRIEEALGRP